MIHQRASLGRLSTIEAGGVLGQTTPWAVDSTHPVFFRVLALLQVRPVCMAGKTVVSLKKGWRAPTTPKQAASSPPLWDVIGGFTMVIKGCHRAWLQRCLNGEPRERPSASDVKRETDALLESLFGSAAAVSPYMPH